MERGGEGETDIKGWEHGADFTEAAGFTQLCDLAAVLPQAGGGWLRNATPGMRVTQAKAPLRDLKDSSCDILWNSITELDVQGFINSEVLNGTSVALQQRKLLEIQEVAISGGSYAKPHIVLAWF